MLSKIERSPEKSSNDLKKCATRIIKLLQRRDFLTQWFFVFGKKCSRANVISVWWGCLSITLEKKTGKKERFAVIINRN